MDYREFLERKSQKRGMDGFAPTFMPDGLFPFQADGTDWAIRKGRALLAFATGLGKTFMELVWAQNVVERTNKPVLILCPLAVAPQTVREGQKFGIEAHVSRDGSIPGKIVVTNYEQLHKFNSADFAGVVGDELACIKAFEGIRRKAVTRFFSKFHYRLGATATPAPNDYIELGTIAEALGEMPQSEMLGTFFRCSDNKRHSLFKEGDFWNRAKYFFRPHGETPFWRWVCSWARACRKPSDLGDFDDTPFILPRLEVQQHIVKTDFLPPGEMFVRVARTLREQRIERQRSLQERCEYVAQLVKHDKPAVVWCEYNPEGDLLEKLIPDSIQVAGCDSDEDKEERLEGFALGKYRVLITKLKIAAWGVNWQNCGHHTFFPTHSYEQYHQGVRRSWRFGRKGPVHIDIVATEGEAGITENLQGKARKADEMFDRLAVHMREEMGFDHIDKHTNEVQLPAWLQTPAECLA